MSSAIDCLHMNHINAVVDGFDESVDHLRDTFGAQLILDMPNPLWRGCLVTLGTVIFELFVTHEPMPDNPMFDSRRGPRYFGIEYQVPDVHEVRKVVQGRGMKLARDSGTVMHTHPADTCGIAIQIFDRNFHAEGPTVPFLEPIKPIGYWRDEHPLGCTGLKRYSVVVSDLDAASAFFQDFTKSTVLYEAARPEAGARAVGLTLADTVVELISPVEAGSVEKFLGEYGEGIRSTVFSVRNLEQARSFLTDRGVMLEPGDAPGTIAVPAETNRGLRFEFSE